MKKTIDARGKQCPIPVIETKKAMESYEGVLVVETRVDNMTAVENLKRFAASIGGTATVTENGVNDYTIAIEGEGKNAAPVEAEAFCTIPNEAPTIAVYASDRMGEGSEELGGILIKGFTYALTQVENTPAKILFYNGGARLTSEGSPLIEDLKKLEEMGTEIITCGTCADFFKIKEKLAVGHIGNMYDIVEAMSTAGRILRP